MIDPTEDTTIELNETVALTLVSGTDYIIGTTTPVVGTIINDDPKILSINNVIVIEGQQSEAILTISVNYTSPLPITFDYITTPINATANTDYISKTGTLTIARNTTSTTVSIPILNDNLNEADESFIITLSNPVNAIIDPDTRIGEVTITDTLPTRITRTLPPKVENLKLNGISAINGTGNAGNNIITGNSANNRLNGGVGNDTLIGGTGNDSLVGGAGLDFFRFNSTSEKVDRITDFNVINDTILVSLSGFGGNFSVGALTTNQFTIGSSATTSEQRFFYNSSNGGLFFDSDGNGATAAVQFATLNTGLALTNADIVVV